jgi:hypothetical protein
MTGRDDPRQRLIRLAASVRVELEQLALVVQEVDLALADFPDVVPPPRDLRGIGDILHDFYTGAEHIFEKIASELDGGMPHGSAWHRELLESMALDLPGFRPPVISRSTVRALEEFLRFRHLFRNVYGFELDWERVKPLLVRVVGVWTALGSDVSAFLVFLDAGGRASE